jgi:hypothetical protein
MADGCFVVQLQRWWYSMGSLGSDDVLLPCKGPQAVASVTISYGKEVQGHMNDWEVVSNSGQEMVLARGMARKALSCPSNRVGSRIFGTANPGQIFDETTIKLLLTDYKI